MVGQKKLLNSLDKIGIRGKLFLWIKNYVTGCSQAVRIGEMTSRLTADCQKMSDMVALNVNIFLRNAVMLIGGFVFIIYLSWQLALITLIVVPLVGFIVKIYGSLFDKISERTQKAISVANQIAEEVLSTMRTVRSFACESREAARFEKALQDTLEVYKKKSYIYVGYIWTNEISYNAVLVGVLFYGGHLVISGKMTSENLISFLFYELQMAENLKMMSYIFGGLMESVGASRKVFEYMYRIPKVLTNGMSESEITGNLQFDRVKFSYPSRPISTVLKEISFSISSGETIALVGPSGGGKSSIVSLIERFYDCNEGVVLVDGVNVKDFDHGYYHQKVVLVAQEPVLFEGTIRNNILYGCDTVTEDDMLQAAKIANVHNFVMEMEKGYDTNCGEKGVQMSGGQKQRIAIARALVRNPAILILDEATSALDTESEHLVREAVAQCANERTVIIIAHRLSTVERADRIIVINKGEVVQQGRHVDLINEEGMYKSLVQRQMLTQNGAEAF